MSRKKSTSFKVNSISYVHDPESAQLWLEQYVDFFKEELIKRASKKVKEQHNHKNKERSDVNEVDRRLL